MTNAIRNAPWSHFHHCGLSHLGACGSEAFAHGKPVVAYATGGIPDWLDDGVTGFLVPPGDVQQLGLRLQRLLTEPELCRLMGAQAQRQVLSLWDSAQHIEQLLNVFRQAMDTRAA